MSLRAMMWVQTRLGLGHLARALTLCGALASDGFEVVLAHGGPAAPTLIVPQRVKVLQLPIAIAPNLESSEILDIDGHPIDDAWRARRIAALKEAIGLFRPDVFLTETFPLGRWLFAFELDPILQWLHALPQRPLIAASVRDILTKPAKPKKVEAMISLLRMRYDLVLCHADDSILRLNDSFPETLSINRMARHTGYVVDAGIETAGARAGVLVVAGGGAVGAKLLRTALDASRLWRRDIGPWNMVAGPRFDAGALATLRSMAPENVTIEGAVGGLSARYAKASLVVGQAGYNTVCEALSQGARLTVVPYATAKETEQTIRAQRFSKLGLLTFVEESGLTTESLVQAMEESLDAPPPLRSLMFNGGPESARILRTALAERRP
jgi:predicted glycosyltransferase